ncbi:hypothetical protein [Corallococcus carmarthensis]|uniref:Uncharacterized protein n=1 Tax=Corallococcus carmarthensis TaxID=2316728 RepID=A0A3A8KJB2_9BACT|nr:hypothetical protein [Corallococcus carmarthensis]NOK19068.1 hypothetical protein [Corallococcus carmarthensis]RKH02014.1 hypothetical protein D7X32_18140 [Corallococcus carmarthensis]
MAHRPAPPPPLSDSQIQAEAVAFLDARGHWLTAVAARRVAAVREFFRQHAHLRRDLLRERAEEERREGRLALELFSRAAQRVRWLLTAGDGPNTRIHGAEAGRDLGLLFAGTDSGLDGLTLEREQRWNLNHPHPLPPTGFRASRPISDREQEEDQTHHLAFYAMFGATNDTSPGEQFGKLMGMLSDLSPPEDQHLAWDGIDLGRKLGDPRFDVNAWLWKTVGDLGQLPPAAEAVAS